MATNNEYRMTLEEIAKVFGVTRERIRQIGSVAIKKLRDPDLDNKFANIRETINLLSLQTEDFINSISVIDEGWNQDSEYFHDSDLIDAMGNVEIILIVH